MELTTVLFKEGKDINNNVYSNELLERLAIEINSKDYNFGEFYKPEWSDVVDLSKISHSYNNARVESGSLIVDIKVLDTPEGIKLKELIEENHLNPIFGARGYGTVVNNVISEKDYKLVSINLIKDEI